MKSCVVFTDIIRNVTFRGLLFTRLVVRMGETIYVCRILITEFLVK
jgi:hypothetical protein